MSKNKEVHDLIVEIRFNLDVSSQEAIDQFQTQTFTNSIKKDVKLLSENRCSGKEKTSE